MVLRTNFLNFFVRPYALILYIEGPDDLLVVPEQVDSLVEVFSKQLSEDAADDDEYLHTPVAELEDEEDDLPPTERPNRCKLADLFVDMPPFDLNMLFEDDFTLREDTEPAT